MDESWLVPQPLASPADYNKRDLKSRLRYAQDLLDSPNINPRVELFMRIYEAVLEAALPSNNDEDARQAATEMVLLQDSLLDNTRLIRRPSFGASN